MLESGSILSSSLTLAVAAIGAGMLAFPLAFASLGLVAATAVLTTVAFFTVVSFYYLALGIERLGLCCYEDMTRILLGQSYEKAVRIMLVALNFGVAVCYVVVIGEMMQPLQPALGRYLDHSGVLYSLVSTPARCLCVVWLFVMLPLSMTRSIAALRFTTALAICASIYIVLAVVYRQVEPSEAQGTCALDWQMWNGATDRDGNLHLSTPSVKNRHKISHALYPSGKAGRMESGVPPLADTPSSAAGGATTVMPSATYGGGYEVDRGSTGTTDDGVTVNTIYFFNVHTIMFLALPIIGYSLDCQCFVFQLFCDMKPEVRNAWAMGKVAALSMAVACLMYLLVGAFGYLSFGERTRGNILQNYDPTADWVMGIGYSLYSVPVVMAYALTIFPLRDAIFNYVYGVSAAEQQDAIPAAHFYAWSLGISVATLAFGVMAPGIVVVIGLLGAICSSTLCFVLPASYRIQMHERGLLPFGYKGGAETSGDDEDPTEMLPDCGVASSSVAASERESGRAPSTDGLRSSAANSRSSRLQNYGSIISIDAAAAPAPADIPTTGAIVSVPLSPALDSALAHTMLWVGIVSGILGTVAATLNILIGIGG